MDNDWQHDKVIIFCHQQSPLRVKSLQASFPLMDVLAANMEYHSQDYAAFMQQYGLPTNDKKLVRFVEKNVISLQTEKLLKLFRPNYQDGSISYDMMVRGFISSYMGSERIFDWDNIILRVLLYGRENEREKQTDFYSKLRGCKDVEVALSEHLTDIFGVSFDDSTHEKVGQMVKVFKYNAIVQNLAPVKADNYKQTRIADGVALQHMNRILELALSQEKTAKALSELFDELGGEIHDADIIRWYGTEANYYYVPEALCAPIITALIEQKIENEPDDDDQSDESSSASKKVKLTSADTFRRFAATLAETRIQSRELVMSASESMNYRLDSISEPNIIELNTYYCITGVDVDDQSTWTDRYKFLVNFRIWKKCNKMITTYINGAKVGRGSVWIVDKNSLESGDTLTRRKRLYDGNVHEDETCLMQPTYKVCTASSFRWQAGMHTIPAESSIKNIYTSRYKGGCIAAPDFSQMELRTMSGASKCKALIEAFRSGG